MKTQKSGINLTVKRVNWGLLKLTASWQLKQLKVYYALVE